MRGMRQNGFSSESVGNGGGLQKEEEVPYAERNEFHVFLNVKKCKYRQETSQ